MRAGISDELTRLVAEQHENATHKPLAPMEAARLFREMRGLIGLMWTELKGWSRRYEPERMARELSDDDWQLFLDVVAETNAFAAAVTSQRGQHR